MKKIINIVVVTLIAITFYSCDSLKPYIKKTTDGWSKHELLPSKITKDGEIFYIGILSDRSTFGVYYDSVTADDSDFYYNRLMQDFKWHRNTKGGWTENSYGKGVRIEYGYIYVNPKRRVGLYFNPKSNGDYKAYKVKLKE